VADREAGRHLPRLTLVWLLRLAPEADEALIIAALGHDLDRAITGLTERDLPQGMNKRDFKQAHAARSAGFIAALMQAYGYADDAIGAVRHLVENHEQGVDRDSALLMDRRLSDQGGKRLAETVQFSSDQAAELYRQTIGDLRRV
jgi:predicted HD phosphohydrolase